MAFNLSSLANNLKGSINNLVDQLTGQTKPGQFYPMDPRIAAVTSNIERGNWLKLPFPYSFDVYDVSTNSFNSNSTSFGEFQLPLAPSEINQREEFAISIKPTMGGTVVNHSGNKYKTLSIAGTTGVAPFRGTGGVDKSSGDAIFQPSDLKFKSGYEVFLQLRNYFRAYYEYKKFNSGNSVTRNHRLVFKNYKDGEFLIVELLNFDMKRSAARPMMYDYSMEFKVLKKVTFEKPGLDFLAQLDNNLNTALNKIDLARGIFLRSQGILRQVESTYDSAILEPLRKISLAVKALQGVETVAGDMGKKALRDTLTTLGTLGILKGVQTTIRNELNLNSNNQTFSSDILPTDLSAAASNQGADAIIDLNENLMKISSSDFPENTQEALASEQASASQLPRSFYENTINDLLRIKANAEDAFNLGSSEYDTLFDRTATLSSDSAKVVTDAEFDVLQAFNEAISAIRAIISTDQLFKSTYNSKIQDVIDQFDNQVSLQALPAVIQITMPRNTDLEELAKEYLGDSSRWVEIAELNDLKYPYVVQDMSDTRSNIVRPGDKILIPQPQIDSFSQAPKGKQTDVTANLSELEKSLGADLKVTKDFDLAIGNNGDLQVIVGPENMAQAVVLKLGYEKGEVRNNPGIGVGLGIGKKFPPLSQIKDDLIASMTQDARIERVEDLALERNGSELKMTFNLKIKNIDIPVPVQIKL